MCLRPCVYVCAGVRDGERENEGENKVAKSNAEKGGERGEVNDAKKKKPMSERQVKEGKKKRDEISTTKIPVPPTGKQWSSREKRSFISTVASQPS